VRALNTVVLPTFGKPIIPQQSPISDVLSPEQ
jgi:hypothetical protein